MILGSGSRPRTNGSGTGRPKNIRNRIRNTATTLYREKIMRWVPRKLAWRPACPLEWREWRPRPWPPPYRPAPPRSHERPGPTRTQKTFNVYSFSNRWIRKWMASRRRIRMDPWCFYYVSECGSDSGSRPGPLFFIKDLEEISEKSSTFYDI